MDRCSKDDPTAKNLVCKKALSIPEKNWKNLLCPPPAILGLMTNKENNFASNMNEEIILLCYSYASCIFFCLEKVGSEQECNLFRIINLIAMQKYFSNLTENSKFTFYCQTQFFALHSLRWSDDSSGCTAKLCVIRLNFLT